MLELRPNCKWRDRGLPPDSAEARICTYECTYCSDCAENVLANVCATCGGNLVARPIRPRLSYRPSKPLGLARHPASTVRKRSAWTAEEVTELTDRLRDVPPSER